MTAGAAGLALTDDGAALHVQRESSDLLSYVYRPTEAQLESPRPYFHPLRTLGGDTVSLYRPHDHVWHKGIVWSLPNVGPYNFWGGPTYVRDDGYVQLDNDGSMDHVAFRHVGEQAGGVGFVEELAWRTPPGPGVTGNGVTGADVTGGDVVVREARECVVSLVEGTGWVLTFRSTVTNVSAGDLPLGSPTTNGRDNAGYGGLFWRGPRSFTGGTILAPGYSGGEDVRGQRHPWMGFTGQHDGSATWSTLVMIDPGTNPGGTPQWFVRNEHFACLCPAPFFGEEIEFAPGQTLTFEYAVVVVDGHGTPELGEDLAEHGRRALAARVVRA
ncbi:PmoA family protein [Oerskovia flava]|uniref:DUF6807 domain-containing protein n=1 Tax=Oerskovia flava TaxID=2986422 RepID=UPI00223EE49E|nr:PmoA family protein [Oerskovia sp. JB1-3-2]